ncbi:hypothetical protein [Nocardioides insulae]|uniref:hypothetical protein n=1 Tax=Nocardioides insulae TaxID=394734 RepID=UPI0012FC711C|nr:hypothetical protein [Nocardioides insulae]
MPLQDGTGFTMDDIQDGPAAQWIITQASVEARLALDQRSIRIDAQRHDATNAVRQEGRIEGAAEHTMHPQTVAGTVVPKPETISQAPKLTQSEPAALTATARGAINEPNTSHPSIRRRRLKTRPSDPSDRPHFRTLSTRQSTRQFGELKDARF